VKDKVSYELTTTEYKGKIQKWDERTSTSPGNNMHLGHLKPIGLDIYYLKTVKKPRPSKLLGNLYYEATSYY
jgi:hypothetical protein